ncbi:hypothetical protein OEB99_16695 [Actinotalea sp. M2MS4P-6]|uniref:hypothetical protein n=1 Tax=Actinotalea sp. M2MS4P-6 TaxID=2983762 RepID=UPI0021E3B410|nr:hypothetical protein [Actinotalea sp. M2MS4P-6]MCV2395956.1 hypothetical protein [Actinotalea sp. M2MS4P-6]
MSTFTLRPVPGDAEHRDLVCTCGIRVDRFLATDRRAIEQAKRTHLCRGQRPHPDGRGRAA